MINGELIVDNFAGGGGASTGIEMATGISVDIAINHDPEAIRMHKANHPSTKHYCENVWAVDPVEACNGHPVGLAWFSPDCKHFSKAKGGKPKDKNIRGLAWVALRWAGLVRPRVIMLENVEEFKTWGPLNRRHHPIKEKQGVTFRKFVRQLEELGYVVEFRELVAADYGAPTMRKRFFMIARCDGIGNRIEMKLYKDADKPDFEWVKGNVIAGYHYQDGIVSMKSDDGRIIWCGVPSGDFRKSEDSLGDFISNADRIRSMSDEELAEFLITVETYGYHDQSVSGTLEMFEWLQSEVEE